MNPREQFEDRFAADDPPGVCDLLIFLLWLCLPAIMCTVLLAMVIGVFVGLQS